MKKRTLLPDEQDYYARNLPHWQPENAVLFMTVRLAGSLPKARVLELKERRADEERLLKNRGLSDYEMKIELRKIYDLYFGIMKDIRLFARLSCPIMRILFSIN